MSIASEISRINENIKAAYTACSNKGAVMPQAKNSANLAETITGVPASGIPVEKIAFSQMNSPVTSYLANASYSPSDYSSSVVERYSTGTTGKHRPDGATVTIPVSGTLTIQDGARSYSVAVSAGIYTVYNVTPDNVGVYTVRNNTDDIVSAGVLMPTGALRMIHGGGDTFNIRDLGGWNCDGGTMKYGMIFRGCELNGDHVTISDDQMRLFRNLLGIRSEIDLRGDSEVDGDDDIYGTDDDITSSALGDDIGYLRRPVGAYTSGVDLSSATQCDYMRDIIKQIATDVKSLRPCYIHCYAGADRTGTVCALIEALCGMSQSDIDKDYELTAFCPEPRARYLAPWASLMNYLNSLPGDNLRDRTVYYLYQIGVTVEEMNTLRRATINGDPTDVVAPDIPAFTNQLPISEYPIGTVSGVMDGKRWRGNGELGDKGTELSYSKASGYISLPSGNCVIRMSGVKFGADTVERNSMAYIHLRGGSAGTSVLNSVLAMNLSDRPTSLNGLTNMEYDNDGNLIMFTVNGDSIRTITICSNSASADGGISDDAVLTVNEIIT